jgi:hypothetical protein
LTPITSLGSLDGRQGGAYEGDQIQQSTAFGAQKNDGEPAIA